MQKPPELPAESVERLQRRLEREQRSRREAESIAETSLSEAWARQRALTLLQSVAVAANAKSARRALETTLAEVCDFTGWPVGHAYMTRGRGRNRKLVSSAIWKLQGGAGIDAFRRASEEKVFVLGEGLPGVALETAEAVWARWFDQDGRFPRLKTAHRAGLRTGLAFPVLAGRETLAVLEFFTHEDLEPNGELLAVLAQVGAQLGRALERERSQARLTDKNRKLEKLVLETERQRQAAEAASRAKSAFLAVTSHEVRTPLNAVLGLAEGLKREPLPARQAEFVDGILDAGGMLVRLLNAVLDLSSLEAGKVPVAAQDFDLIATLRRIERVWRAKAAQMDVDFELALKGADGALMTRSDPGKIEQSLTNLISNALKFTPEGGRVLVRGLIRPDGAGYDVILSVEDSGPGIAEADRERILRPYEQTAAGKAAGGAGLGLAICVGNMEALGGFVSIGASSMGGAKVTLAFPVERGEDAPAPARAASSTTEQVRILAAEDNAANRRVLEVLLEPLTGVDLVFALNGREALEAVAAADFDLVLMDANMPEMDGVEAVRAIRARGLQLPVHMLTANALAHDIAIYEAAGADGVLAKPIAVEALYDLIARCVPLDA